MLGKLIKHEFKAVNRLMIPLHLALIVITVIGRFYIQLTLSARNEYFYSEAANVWYGVLDMTLVLFYIIALVAISIITSVYLTIIRFRKNLFTDEGYLMHTLPVTASQLIWSKTLVAFVWTLIDGALVILSVAAMVINKEILQAIPESLSILLEGFQEVFGVPAAAGIPLYLVLFIIDLAGSILMIYMCIAIGHSFNSHKILGSVGIYVGITVVMNLVSTIFAAFSGSAAYGDNIFFSYATGVGMPTPAYFWLSYLFGLFLSVVTAVVSYFLTDYFMTRKLNLE